MSSLRDPSCGDTHLNRSTDSKLGLEDAAGPDPLTLAMLRFTHPQHASATI
jgi:hypothetical protein